MYERKHLIVKFEKKGQIRDESVDKPDSRQVKRKRRDGLH